MAKRGKCSLARLLANIRAGGHLDHDCMDNILINSSIVPRLSVADSRANQNI